MSCGAETGNPKDWQEKKNFKTTASLAKRGWIWMGGEAGIQILGQELSMMQSAPLPRSLIRDQSFGCQQPETCT